MFRFFFSFSLQSFSLQVENGSCFIPKKTYRFTRPKTVPNVALEDDAVRFGEPERVVVRDEGQAVRQETREDRWVHGAPGRWKNVNKSSVNFRNQVDFLFI
jgi:hypothetical protein